MTGVTAVVAAGTGRYGDPYHPFVETSEIVAQLLRGDGWEATVNTDVDSALASLDSVDLLVVNAGDPWRNGETGFGADPAALDGLKSALDRGIGVLALHNAVSTLRDYPAWLETVGGEWIPGTTRHPKISDARVQIVKRHPITEGVDDFTTFDERYIHLRVEPDVQVLAAHELNGVQYPLLWAREVGGIRAVYLALGHNARAFEAAGTCQLIAQAARWASRLS